MDLRKRQIYQQDPPTGPNQRPRRWLLPEKFVERLPENPAMASKQSAELMSIRFDEFSSFSSKKRLIIKMK